ncbi:hypothetical protein [Mastigocladopsis repens]|uniref:hypothetical protein n=1 Tax=Mastigocladopsis repens TaxID=221287 RepID=UPI0002E7CCC3|nr:hypothetical protein [Mastigocladopsis repens]
MNNLPNFNHSNNHNNSNSNNHTNNHKTSEDWHQRMAYLVGLEEEKTPSNEESSFSNTASSNNDEAPPSDPSLVRTQQSLSSNPFAKVGVVGAGTLFVVVVAGAFLSQLMSGTNKQQQKNFPVVTQKDDSKKIEQLKPEEEIEILKTKLALAEQAKAVKAAQLQLKTVRPNQRTTNPTAQPKTKPQPATRVVVERVPTPAQTVYVPRVVERIVRVPQPVAQANPTPTQPAQTPQPTAISPPSFEISNPGLTPSELAEVPLSLSTVTPTPTEPPVAPTQPPVAPTQPTVASSPPSSFSPENYSARERGRMTTGSRRPNITSQPNTTTNPQERSQLGNRITRYNKKSVAVGTSAKAVLVTALFGEANKPGVNNTRNKNDGKDDTTFVVRLKEPLKSVDGAIALPANTELLAQIQQISDSGMVQLGVVSIISQANGNFTQTRLPESTLKVRAPQGKPLLANKYPNRSGKISSMDTGIFALGGIGKIGDVLNRPETTRVRCDDGTDNYCTETDQQRNIPAAVLEGGMNAIVPQINQRNQQAIQEMMKSGIWFLPSGTEVEVFANQIMRF